MPAFLGNFWPPDPEDLQWGLQWLRARPVCAGTAIPLALDLALLLSDTFPNEGIYSKVASALIPTWEDLKEAGMSANGHLPSFHDLDALEHLSSKSSIIDWLVKTVTNLGSRYGLYLWYGSRPDEQDLFLIYKIADRARMGGLTVLLNVPGNIVNSIRSDLFTFIGHSPSSHLQSEEERTIVATYIANSPHGLNQVDLQQLGFCDSLDIPRYGAKSSTFVCDKSRAVVLDEGRERMIHEALYKLTKPDRYGYLIKCFHAASSKNLHLLCEMHYPLICSATHVALPQLERHYMAFAEVLSKSNDANAAYAHFSLGRVVQDMNKKSGKSSRPQLHYLQSYRLSNSPEDKIEIIYYIANHYAKERSAVALQKASRWYAKGFRLLKKIKDSTKRAQRQIRLYNGLALIAYIQGENDRALELEERAMEVARQSRIEGSTVYAWAFPILSLNTAKLLTQRYGQFHSAKQMLAEVVTTASNAPSEYATIELAKIEFDQHNYDIVVKLLGTLCERDDWIPFDEVIEIYVRVMFTLSLAFTKKLIRAKEQCNIALKAADFSGNSDARKLVEQVAMYINYCESSFSESHN